jgi:hypothetical protein
MMRKTTICGLAAAAMLLAPAPAQGQIDRDTIETLGVMLLADRIGIDPQLILATRQTTKASVFDLAPSFVLHREARSHSPERIWELRRRGMGWGQIAQEIGIHPGTFNQMRNRGDFDVNRIWRDSLRGGFNLDEATVQRLRSMGLTWQDISTASMISAESGRSIWQVVDLYRSTRNWSTVASRLGVRQAQVNERLQTWRSTKSMPNNWRRVVVTPPSPAQAGQNKGAQGKGQGKGKGKGGG